MTPPAWPDLLLVNLRYGRDSARTLGELAEAMGAPRRELEKATEQLRRDGRPVCSGSDGIWLTTDAAELEAQVAALRRRAVHQLVTVRSLRATARRMGRHPQMTAGL